MRPGLRFSNGKRGFSLTELAIVMGVVGIVISGIWVASSQVNAQRLGAKAQTQVLNIAQAVRAQYSNQVYLPQASGGGVNPMTTTLLNMGVFDTDMITASPPAPSPVISPYKGAVTVTANPSGGATPSTVFRISYYGITEGQCVHIAQGIVTSANQNSASGPQGLTTACGTGGGATVNLKTTPLDLGGVQALCHINTGAACTSVEFDFNL